MSVAGGNKIIELGCQSVCDWYSTGLAEIIVHSILWRQGWVAPSGSLMVIASENDSFGEARTIVRIVFGR